MRNHVLVLHAIRSTSRRSLLCSCAESLQGVLDVPNSARAMLQVTGCQEVEEGQRVRIAHIHLARNLITNRSIHNQSLMLTSRLIITVDAGPFKMQQMYQPNVASTLNMAGQDVQEAKQRSGWKQPFWNVQLRNSFISYIYKLNCVHYLSNE